MKFTIRNYVSEERFDLAKLMPFDIDVYDVLNSPFLNKIKTLPVVRYYNVNTGYKDIDMISQDVYKSPYYSFFIQYYNDIMLDKIPEDKVLKMFDLQDLDNLFFNISNGRVN